MALPLVPDDRRSGPGLRRSDAPAADVPVRSTMAGRAGGRARRRARWRQPSSGTGRRSSRFASPTASSWPATGGPPTGNVIAHRADGEGLPGRPLLGGGHRRRRRAGDRDGPALPDSSSSTTRRSRASPSASRARPTSSAQMVREQPAGMAMQGLVVVPLFAGYDLRRRHGPHLHLRRHRRPLRGGRLPRHRARAAATPGTDDQARLPRRARRATTPSSSPSRRSYEAADEDSRHRRPRPRCAASTRSWPRSPPQGYAAGLERRRGRRALRRRSSSGGSERRGNAGARR